MSTEEIFATGRVVERLMICAFGGLSLTYGWNLFRIGVLNDQSAEFAAKGWRINLKRVGPGAFFALFGCAVLSLSLRSPLGLSLTTEQQATNRTIVGDSEKSSVNKTKSEAVYLENQDEQIAKRWVADLNTIFHVATPDKFPSATEKKVITRTEEDLETLRNTLVMRKFGGVLFQDYKVYQKKIKGEGWTPSEEERQKFSQIDEWMQANRILE
jgi:hypothetical protein